MKVLLLNGSASQGDKKDRDKRLINRNLAV